MHLKSFHIRRAPGIDRELAATDLDSNLIVLFGPNASGKSTVGRLIRGVLWQEGATLNVEANTVWVMPKDDAAGGVAETTASVFARQVDWQPTGPVDVPAGTSRPWLATLDDLLQATDHEFAEQIVRELYAGYDLAALAREFPIAAKPNAIWRELETARRAVGARIGEQRALSDSERRLVELDQLIAGSKAAQAERSAVQDAADLARARAELVGFHADSQAFDSRVGKLSPDANERIADRESALEEATQASARAALSAADARRTADQFALSYPEPSSADLQEWNAWVDTATEWERKLDELRLRRAQARAAIESAAAHVKEGEKPMPPPDSVLAELEKAVHSESSAAERLRVASAELSVVEEPASEDVATDGEALDRAVFTLQEWSKAWASSPGRATATTGVGPVWIRWLFIGAFLSVLVAAVVTGQWITGAAAVIALCAVAFAWYRARQGAVAGKSSVDLTASFEDGWPRNGVAGPAAWTVGGVVTRIAELQDQRGRQVVERERAGVQDQRRREFNARLSAARAAMEEETREVETLCQRAGVQPGFARASVIIQVEQLRMLHAALAAEADLGRQIEHMQAQYDGLMGRAAAAIGPCLPSVRCDWDAQVIRSTTRQIEAEIAAYRTASRDSHHAGQREAEARHRCAEALRVFAELCEEYGCHQDRMGEVRELSAEYPAWREARAALDRARRSVAQLEARLSNRDDLLSLSPADAEARLNAINESQRGYTELVDEQRSLKMELEATYGGTRLRDLEAQVERASERLSERRRDAYASAVGRELSTWIREQVTLKQAPATLSGAQARFARFTRGEWTLTVDADSSSAALTARQSSSGRTFELCQLSNATRVQLLLAARLAHIEHLEGGTPLPLFLDEALSTTDPARYDAVAEVVLALVEDGRQVFYATSSPDELERWRQTCADRDTVGFQVIDLSEAADVGATWKPSIAGSPEPTPVVPEPRSGESPEAWFARVGVRLPRRDDAFGNWPAALLLYDDLSASAECLRAGATSVGQVSALIGGSTPHLGLVDGQRERFEMRSRWLEQTLRAASVGFGRRVTWGDVVASTAISPTYEEQSRRALEEVDGDARAFLREVDGFKGFRRKQFAQLQEAIEACGAIDDRSRLSAEQAVEYVLNVSGDDLVAGRTTMGEIRAFVEWALQVLAAAG